MGKKDWKAKAKALKKELEALRAEALPPAVQAVAEYVACSSGDTMPTSRFHSDTGVPSANPRRSIRPPAAGLRSP